MEYMIKLDGPAREVYIKMPGTVSQVEWELRLEEAENKYQEMKIEGWRDKNK
jgi:hypothetical protein